MTVLYPVPVQYSSAILYSILYTVVLVLVLRYRGGWRPCKYCIFHPSTQDLQDPVFYHSSVAPSDAWKKSGMRQNSSLHSGAHCSCSDLDKKYVFSSFFYFLHFTNYNYVQFTSFLYFRDRRRPQLRHFIFHKMFKVQRFAFNNICDPSPLFFFAPSQCGRCGQDATPPSHVPAFHSHSIFVQQCSSTPSLLHRAGAAGPEHTPFLAHPIRLFLYPSHLPPPQSLSCVQWQPPLGPEGEVAPP